MPAYVQSNTQEGLITVAASTTTMYAKEGYLACIVASGVSAVTKVASASGHLCLYVVEEGEAASSPTGTNVVLRPLSPDRNVRVIAGSNISAGIRLMASAGGAAIPWTAAESLSFVLGVSESCVASGGYLLMRPCMIGAPSA